MNKFDIFGSNIQFMLNNKQFNGTKFGSIITFLIFIIIFIRSFYILKSLINNQQLQILYKDQVNTQLQSFQINSKEFFIAFAIQNKNNNQRLINNSIYQIEAQQVFLSLNQEKIKTINLPLIPCQNLLLKDQNLGFNLTQLRQLSLQNYYCFDQQIDIQQNQQDFDSYVQIILKECKNQEQCLSRDKIQQALQYSQLSIIYQDNIFDYLSESGFQSHFEKQNWNINQNIQKDIQLVMKNSFVSSDEGTFFENITNQKMPTFFQFKEEFELNPSSDYFIKLDIKLQKDKINQYQRIYKNINNFISDIGGYLTICLIIGSIICKPFSKLNLQQQLINQFFDFDLQQENQNDNVLNQELKKHSPKHKVSQFRVKYKIKMQKNQKKNMFFRKQSKSLNSAPISRKNEQQQLFELISQKKIQLILQLITTKIIKKYNIFKAKRAKTIYNIHKWNFQIYVNHNYLSFKNNKIYSKKCFLKLKNLQSLIFLNIQNTLYGLLVDLNKKKKQYTIALKIFIIISMFYMQQKNFQKLIN
ncbi:hypothetical protein IMG5_145780 [Ichthyophthirius multifiliis]|uniref:Transmembrane protein n=1 Tax=Ichthyophthirius multifiliis TaxID=5932 RepID=G0QXX2_ICHMU|nr:hypothetical protein IMG5_145780 [Ichthyophthirius multifiliis]EGR29924.1 hypothetical protein IMG5_145780 [Ichthyophthirius multifiliis]|eukprot:XP_004031160.1 hypothetical protein IMG5_145780 [Ichthyophthirius multifiliis]